VLCTCVFCFKQKTAYEMGRVTGVQTCALPISLQFPAGDLFSWLKCEAKEDDAHEL